MKQPLFTGSAVAAVTPFSGGAVDYPAFRRLIRRQVDRGSDAIVVCGTTGEAATLTPYERRQLLDEALREVDGRIPVVAGTGSNNTAGAVEFSRDAQSLGADGLLVVTPYYNKATQDGLVRHFTAVADAVDVPVILYNVPSRTGVSCSAQTYATLAAHPNIIGVKEASGNFALIADTRNLCPEDFYLWSGNDEDNVAVCALGGVGVISVTANLIPDEIHRLTALCLAQQYHEAARLQLSMTALNRALFSEVNPIPIKTALAHLALCSSELRLPLTPMLEENARRLFEVMEAYGIAPEAETV